MAQTDPAQEGMRIIIRFYQAGHRAYTIYLGDARRIEGRRHFRSPERALKYVNELMEQGHPIGSPESLQRLRHEARDQGR